MAEHLLKAYEEDIEIRTKGLENGDPKAYVVDAREIRPGVILKDENVTVKAFAVPHGQWKEAYGFRFETNTRSACWTSTAASNFVFLTKIKAMQYIPYSAKFTPTPRWPTWATTKLMKTHFAR